MNQDQELEVSVRNLRLTLADVLNDVAVHGRTAYITSRGRRIAALVPLSIVEHAQGTMSPVPDPSGAPLLSGGTGPG